MKRAREADAAALSAEELASILAAGEDIPSLDANGVKRLLLRLERACTRNAALRAKHAAEPIKFLDSEVELHQAQEPLPQLVVLEQVGRVMVVELDIIMDLFARQVVVVELVVLDQMLRPLKEAMVAQDYLLRLVEIRLIMQVVVAVLQHKIMGQQLVE